VPRQSFPRSNPPLVFAPPGAVIPHQRYSEVNTPSPGIHGILFRRNSLCRNALASGGTRISHWGQWGIIRYNALLYNGLWEYHLWGNFLRVEEQRNGPG